MLSVSVHNICICNRNAHSSVPSVQYLLKVHRALRIITLNLLVLRQILRVFYQNQSIWVDRYDSIIGDGTFHKICGQIVFTGAASTSLTAYYLAASICCCNHHISTAKGSRIAS